MGASAVLRPRGLTLVELMIAIVVAAILATLAVPSFVELMQRQRLQSAASGLMADLQYARTEAQRRRSAVTLVHVAGQSDYVLTDGPAILKKVPLPPGVSMESTSIAFEPLRGLAATGGITLSSTGAPSLKVQLAETGRTHACSPDGRFGGMEVCEP